MIIRGSSLKMDNDRFINSSQWCLSAFITKALRLQLIFSTSFCRKTNTGKLNGTWAAPTSGLHSEVTTGKCEPGRADGKKKLLWRLKTSPTCKTRTADLSQRQVCLDFIPSASSESSPCWSTVRPPVLMMSSPLDSSTIMLTFIHFLKREIWNQKKQFDYIKHTHTTVDSFIKFYFWLNCSWVHQCAD